jgi:hypothetical protein
MVAKIKEEYEKISVIHDVKFAWIVCVHYSMRFDCWQ